TPEKLTHREQLTPKASIDTTIATLSHFILTMVQYPHVLRRAQAELDDVLGSGGDGLGSASKANRLPTFEDRAKLPYCDGCSPRHLDGACLFHLVSDLPRIRY
ncbi:hypothetical protein BDR07DRAFT_1423263, partial [Suillus spraguei]